MFSCIGDDSRTDVQGIYFDIPAYFHQEVLRLKESNTEIQKTIVSDSGTEEKLIRQPDFNKEFGLFYELDLNTPALRNMYLVDTLSAADTSIVHYTAKDSSLELSTLTIKLLNKELFYLAGQLEGNSKISAIQTNIEYKPNTGYQISKTSKALIGAKFNFDIVVKFIN